LYHPLDQFLSGMTNGKEKRYYKLLSALAPLHKPQEKRFTSTKSRTTTAIIFTVVRMVCVSKILNMEWCCLAVAKLLNQQAGTPDF
jgi:hypothetical protein